MRSKEKEWYWLALYMFIQGFKHATLSCIKLGGLIGRRGKELSFKRVRERERERADFCSIP